MKKSIKTMFVKAVDYCRGDHLLSGKSLPLVEIYKNITALTRNNSHNSKKASFIINIDDED